MNKKTRRNLKRILMVLSTLLVLMIVVIIYANWKIPSDSDEYVFDNVNEMPVQKAALVLGAAPNIGNNPNPYFTNRINAAIELYKAGNVKSFVVSGDNSRESYNEPEYMREALVAGGVPDSVIYLDYAGFRTLDSVVRMNKIFGQDSFIVVSQKFHNERAVFLAQYYGLTAYGYNAVDLNVNRSSLRTKVREVFARVKVFVDIIVGKDPKFLGDPIEIK